MAANTHGGAAFDPSTLKAAFPGLADPNLHYLDSAATAQMPEPVFAALRRFETTARANVHGGQHRLARAALALYNEARADIARFLHARTADEIIFTSGATASFNLLAHSFGGLLHEGDEILLSMLEHHSNLLPWRQLARRRGVVLRLLPMTREGRLDLAQLELMLTTRVKLVALTHCSNVTGALTDVDRVVAAARGVGAQVLLDGAQRLPHGLVDVQALGIDFYAFSGHKCYGPTGIGVLWGRRELLADMPPFMTGGQMIRAVTLDDVTYADPPRRFEAGTPPIAGAIGLGAAIRWMETLDWSAVRAHELRLTRRILDQLPRLPGIRVLGPLDIEERRGVIAFHIDGMTSEQVCTALDVRGVALRGGYHCAQPLVEAFGVHGAARASLAPYSTDADVDALLEGAETLVRPTLFSLSQRQ
jgi:cysteine desulfurase/selenocysteine lyase